VNASTIAQRVAMMSVPNKRNRVVVFAGTNDLHPGPALLGGDREPDPDNYRFDGLHLSARGYAIWTDIIRTRLLADLEATKPRTGAKGEPGG